MTEIKLWPHDRAGRGPGRVLACPVQPSPPQAFGEFLALPALHANHTHGLLPSQSVLLSPPRKSHCCHFGSHSDPDDKAFWLAFLGT